MNSGRSSARSSTCIREIDDRQDGVTTPGGSQFHGVRPRLPEPLREPERDSPTCERAQQGGEDLRDTTIGFGAPLGAGAAPRPIGRLLPTLTGHPDRRLGDAISLHRNRASHCCAGSSTSRGLRRSRYVRPSSDGRRSQCQRAQVPEVVHRGVVMFAHSTIGECRPAR